MRSNLALKIGLTLMTLYYVYVPAMADIGDSHLHSDEWSDHSRVHLVWFLVFTGLVGAVGVGLMWVRDTPIVSALIGLSFNGAFLVAGALASSYGGVVSNADGVPIQVIEFGTLAVLFLAAVAYLAVRHRRSITAVAT